ncbi:50S ribosomal protein L11 methyltransferase [Neokomagataea thailandica NBRC 106555]|uniref:Methyltransferase n=2 Tax=Neokomagataea TaxID=1223423 RepID=A0A4Y6V2W8_9PROT|nr:MULTISPECIES: 50S ribosomal protein L11 methyltransferase [Neokomagataea]QDH24379.1 methyltransferase [Neokomagataea tanensis]GBR53340.1 50S ribosomal protein L11 methyltransferase [Neokomagataea thailandica NBRC 106555]
MTTCARHLDFIRAHTTQAHAPLVPEIPLYLATEITPLWQASSDFLERHNLEPPYWAFAWPGSQLIARTILDNPNHIRGKTVLDFACGGGLAGIAAAKAGAQTVSGNDIDSFALSALTLNAALNEVTVSPVTGDLVGTQPECDIMIVGDVCYDAAMTAHILPWLARCATRCEVWLCDPGRHYGPQGKNEHSNLFSSLEVLSQKNIPTSRDLESADTRLTTLYRLPKTPA